MNAGVLTKLIKGAGSDLADNLSYKTANKELKNAINFQLNKSNPELFMPDVPGGIFSEGGGTNIPRIHVDDLKAFGYDSDVPAIYKRKTGARDLDELAGLAGYNSTSGSDDFLESIMNELGRRKDMRDNVLTLREMRNDPDVIKQAMSGLDEDMAMYGPSNALAFEPSKRDYNWYLKNVVMKSDEKNKPIKINVMRINNGDGRTSIKVKSNKITNDLVDSKNNLKNNDIEVSKLAKPINNVDLMDNTGTNNFSDMYPLLFNNEPTRLGNISRMLALRSYNNNEN